MFKFIYFLFISLFVSNLLSAQRTEWLTTIRPGGNEYVWDVTTDHSGNIIATGRVKFSSIFGWTPNTQSPPAYGTETDVFVVKYDSNGNLIWVNREGGYEPDWGRAVTIDSENSVFVVGDFCDTARFGNDTIIGLGSVQNRNLFICKYDSTGILQWVKSAGNAGGHSRAYSISTDELGNSYICGHISGLANIDGNNFGVNNYSLPFICKIDPWGNCLWAKHFPVNTSGEANSIFYKNGFIYVTGMYKGTMIINGNSFPGNSTSWNDVFLTKWDVNGNFVWCKTANGQYQDIGYNLYVSNNNQIFVIGSFANDLNFGLDTTINSYGSSGNASSANANNDVFISKYDSNGTLSWVKTINGKSGVAGSSITSSLKTGLVYISGGIKDTCYFDNDTLISNSSSLDVLIISIDTLGNKKWIKTFGGIGNDNGKALAIDNSSNIILGGYYQNSFNFDTIPAPSALGDDGFICKIIPPLMPQFLTNDSIVCQGDSIYYSVLQDGAPLNYQWLINGNLYNSVADSTYIDFNNPGNSTVSLILSNNYETDTFFINNVLVNAFPIVSIGNDTTLCHGTQLQLNAGNFSQYLWSDNSQQNFLDVFSTGNYWVSVTDTNGCTNIDSIFVNYYPESTVSLGSDTTLCDSLSLLLDPGSYSTYLWSNNSIGQTLTVDSTGNYAVQVTDFNNCVSSDTILITFNSCLNIEENNYYHLVLWPNPFSNELNLIFDEPFSGKIIITDEIGKVFLSKDVFHTINLALSTDQLVPGLYLLNYSNAKMSGVFKLIKY